MRQKVLFSLVTVVVALSAATIAVAIGRTTESPQQYDHLTNSGIPVAVSERNASILRDGGGEPVLNRLGTRAGVAFYAGRGATGGPCYAIGPVETGGIAALACLRPPTQFPSADTPILNLSGISANPQAHSITFLGLSGLAADGVARVGLIGADGVLHDTEVQDNIYYADLPQIEAKALVAFDPSGQEIFRHSFGRRVPAPPVS